MSMLAAVTTLKISLAWDFPGGPVVKTASFTAGGTGSIPDWGTKIPPIKIFNKKLN